MKGTAEPAPSYLQGEHHEGMRKMKGSGTAASMLLVCWAVDTPFGTGQYLLLRRLWHSLDLVHQVSPVRLPATPLQLCYASG